MVGARGAFVAQYMTVPSVCSRLPSTRLSRPRRSRVAAGQSNIAIRGKKNVGATGAKRFGQGRRGGLLGPCGIHTCTVHVYMCAVVWALYLGDDSCFCSEPLPKNLFPWLCTSLTPHTSHTITTITIVTTPWLCKLKGCRAEYLKVRGVRV